MWGEFVSACVVVLWLWLWLTCYHRCLVKVGRLCLAPLPVLSPSLTSLDISIAITINLPITVITISQHVFLRPTIAGQVSGRRVHTSASACRPRPGQAADSPAPPASAPPRFTKQSTRVGPSSSPSPIQQTPRWNVDLSFRQLLVQATGAPPSRLLSPSRSNQAPARRTRLGYQRASKLHLRTRECLLRQQ